VTQILLIIAVVLIIILYTKTLHGIANYVIPLRKALKVKIKTLAMIPLVQVVMLGLVLYNNAILILTSSPSLIISPTIAAIISGLTGAANVAVYLMQNGATAPGSPDTTAAFL